VYREKKKKGKELLFKNHTHYNPIIGERGGGKKKKKRKGVCGCPPCHFIITNRTKAHGGMGAGKKGGGGRKVFPTLLHPD